MKDKLIYPIIVAEINDEDGHYFVATSPNIDGMVTQGDTMIDVVENSEDAIATMIEGDPYPQPQDPSIWKIKHNERLVYVTVDMKNWLSGKTKTVHKTITIPKYVNELGMSRKINFSQIATKALKDELQIS
ncbi:antitoxin HicB [Paucilactobacillus hokkaidonensis JCM 18461]|uniref:Antitoxin HicB n=2 Tax=Paucilactobacillus hokkaidonensis TaxID=1193095 RepID=A0A0A1GWT4_9LACO|nr:type II toxin-antitoxin system HicB family antitoxin [Paucilactobacillus hokkaidonensis]KRO09374.1 putative phage protein [Paucilactobacillus hokkaidonensis]BAP84881.1 antitoxin HicB [Paucilactobacillus hokkaidonensis JCM 18461]